MRIRKVVMSALVLLLAGSVISPAASAGEVAKRIDNQEARIAQGVGSGELTAREAAKLEKGDVRIAAHRARALSDGVMTPKEAAKLNRQENKQSRKIFRAKHNARKRS